MMSNSTRSLLAIVIIIIVLVVGIRACQYLSLSRALRINQEISELDTNTYSKNVPKEYTGLFWDTTKLICDNVVTSRHRSLIIEFHNDQFYIQVNKLDTLNDASIREIVNETFSPSEMSMYSYYGDYSSNKRFEIRYKLGHRERLTRLHFALDGDHTRIIEKNDSVAYYYSSFKNFSIRNQEGGKIDIFGKTKSVNLPIEIMFLKRRGNVYFIFLTSKNYSTSLDPNALYNLVIGNK